MFDVARHLLLVDVDGMAEVGRERVELEDTRPTQRTRRLTELGVNTLICEAISAPLQATLAAAGVCVVPHACGPVEEVLQAFLAGRLADAAFQMPGCCQRQRLRVRRRGVGPTLDARGDVERSRSPSRRSQNYMKGR